MVVYCHDHISGFSGAAMRQAMLAPERIWTWGSESSNESSNGQYTWVLHFAGTGQCWQSGCSLLLKPSAPVRPDLWWQTACWHGARQLE